MFHLAISIAQRDPLYVLGNILHVVPWIVKVCPPACERFHWGTGTFHSIREMGRRSRGACSHSPRHCPRLSERGPQSGGGATAVEEAGKRQGADCFGANAAKKRSPITFGDAVRKEGFHCLWLGIPNEGSEDSLLAPTHDGHLEVQARKCLLNSLQLGCCQILLWNMGWDKTCTTYTPV